MSQVRSFEDIDALHDAAAQQLSDALAQGLGRQDRVGFMVSGGRTPKILLPMLLSRSDLDWDRIDLIASDERVVPQGDPASTETMIRQIFAKADQPCNYASIGSDLDPNAALSEWLRQKEAMVWPPTTAFLGMGDDAHTASLFPGRPESGDSGFSAGTVPETPPHVGPRLTFGPTVLSDCQDIVLIANSAAKVQQLRSAQSPAAKTRDFPVKWLLDLHQTTVFKLG